MSLKIQILVATAFTLAFQPSAHSAPYISVGRAQVKKSVMAIAPFQSMNAGARNVAQKIYNTLENNLQYMNMFKFLPRSSFLENPAKAGVTPDRFRFSDWTSLGTELLIKVSIRTEADKIRMEAYLYSATRGRQLLAKRYIGDLKDAKLVAHTFGNDIMKTLTGFPGIFQTKIAMSCMKRNRKEIYVMDFDGKNVKQVTRHRSIAFSPAWSPDGSRLAYSLYTQVRRGKRRSRNINLYEYNFRTNKLKLLSNKKGINSGASYSPDGRSIALTMSFLGNPEIFVLDLFDRTVKRLTKSFGFDVDPAWDPKGRKLAFVSNRRGKPMVFSINKNGTRTQRLTIAGRYNATPSWSPRGDKIAFAGWIDGRFDIFIMNSNGTNIQRLTKNVGNNEDPYFSPDGNFIIFSSNRTGKKQIYVMNRDGSYVKRLTYGLGNCVAPKWSNAPRT